MIDCKPRPRPELGQRIYELRERARLSQEQLARRAGLCHGAIQYLERGLRQDPRLSTLLKLCQGLETPLSTLLGHDGLHLPEGAAVARN